LCVLAKPILSTGTHLEPEDIVVSPLSKTAIVVPLCFPFVLPCSVLGPACLGPLVGKGGISAAVCKDSGSSVLGIDCK